MPSSRRKFMIARNQTPVFGYNGPVWDGDDIELTCSYPNATYSWTGPDSFSSTQQNPVIQNSTFSMNGNTYHCTVTDGNNTYEGNVTVVVKKVSADFSTTINGLEVTFHNTTQVAPSGYSSEIDEFSWNFGDGGTSNLYNPVHTYSTQGTYTVSLTVSSSVSSSPGSSNTKQTTITV